MKKIFTFLFFACIGTAVFAQGPGNDFDKRGRGNNAYNDWNGPRDKHYNDRRYLRLRQMMEAEIADINREYNRKVASVRDNWHMHSFKKQRLINKLESRRRDKINAVYVKFNGNRRDYSYNGSRH